MQTAWQRLLKKYALSAALLLPNPEGVDTVEQQIAIARQKAGIREGEAVALERFEVVRH